MLAEKFWPGPLTPVSKKAQGMRLTDDHGRTRIPWRMRVPSHPLFLKNTRATLNFRSQRRRPIGFAAQVLTLCRTR